MDAFNHSTDGPKRRRRVSSTVSDTWCSEICESPGAAVRKGEVAPASLGDHRRSGGRRTTSATPPTVQNGGGESPPPFRTFGARRSANPPVLRCEKARRHPPPRVSIAGREGDGRLRPPSPRAKTAEESFLRRFGRFALGDRGIPPRWVAKRREGTRLPGCPSPVGTAMDDFGQPTHGPKRPRRVSPVVLDSLDSGIAGFLRAVLRKGEVADPPPRVSIAGRDGDGRVHRPRKRCKTAWKSLPRRCAPLLGVDRLLPPRRESKCARRAPLSPHPPPGEPAMNGCDEKKNGSKPPNKVS